MASSSDGTVTVSVVLRVHQPVQSGLLCAACYRLETRAVAHPAWNVLVSHMLLVAAPALQQLVEQLVCAHPGSAWTLATIGSSAPVVVPATGLSPVSLSVAPKITSRETIHPPSPPPFPPLSTPSTTGLPSWLMGRPSARRALNKCSNLKAKGVRVRAAGAVGEHIHLYVAPRAAKGALHVVVVAAYDDRR